MQSTDQSHRRVARGRTAAPAVLLLAAAACAPQVFRADAGAALIEARGDFGLQNSGGTLVLEQNQNDLRDDLGVGDREASPYARAEVEWGGHRVELSGFGYESSGSGVLAADFGDIPAGTQVATSLDFFSVTGAWSYDLVPGDMIRVAPGVQLSYYSLDFTARSVTPAAFETVTTDVVVPKPYVTAELETGVFSALASIGWIDIDLGDANGSYWDAEAMIRVRPLPGLELLGGYRHLAFDAKGTADGRDFLADVQITGFVLGGGIRF